MQSENNSGGGSVQLVDGGDVIGRTVAADVMKGRPVADESVGAVLERCHNGVERVPVCQVG